MDTIKYSVVVPVYNRPDEIAELLESLSRQTSKDFEVIVVEDGSQLPCEHVIKKFTPGLTVSYYYKQNEGPGPARNFAFEKAAGRYFVCFDSDCVIPPHYFDAVDEALKTFALDAWGGPDRAHQDFTWLQRAMGYTMSSVLTTGGIRGNKKRIGWFQPRSFNMGISREVYRKVGGFRFSRYAEDIEFSIRIRKEGFKSGLVERAFVYHKRRTSFGQFFKQVFNFGRGRALVGKAHPSEIKITHWFPSIFTIGLFLLPVFFFVHRALFAASVLAFVLYLAGIFLGSLLVNKHFVVALLSIPSAIIQLVGYGLGFFKEKLKTYL